MDHPQAQRGVESSHARPIRYNPVPIGGPDRPPLNTHQSPSPGAAAKTGSTYASSPGPPGSNGRNNGRRGSNLRASVSTPGLKREPGAADDSDYLSEPPSAVTQQSDHSPFGSTGKDLKSEERDVEEGEPQRKKQKRNKPTLSCFECVERKTKVGFNTFTVFHTLIFAIFDSSFEKTYKLRVVVSESSARPCSAW